MKKCKITVIRKTEYPDLMEKYENPIEHACELKEGQVFIANGWKRPNGLCESAWESMSAFVLALSHGGGDFYDGWMKNPKTAKKPRRNILTSAPTLPVPRPARSKKPRISIAISQS